MTRARNFVPMLGLTAVLVLCLSSGPAFSQAASSTYEPERTTWNTPDIQGIWDFRTLTPFARPAELADKPVLTPEEARAFRDQAIQLLDGDNRTDEAKQDVEGAYNNFWFDW